MMRLWPSALWPDNFPSAAQGRAWLGTDEPSWLVSLQCMATSQLVVANVQGW